MNLMNKNKKIERRILIIKNLAKGKSSRNIGRELKCDQKLIFYWRDRYLKEGIKGLISKKIPGRPSKINLKQIKNIRNQLIKKDIEYLSIDNIIKLIEKETSKKYSATHMQRLLIKWGFHKIYISNTLDYFYHYDERTRWGDNKIHDYTFKEIKDES